MKYIKNETINHFKKFINKLYKKEEDSLLNKKKKREEIKQKNKAEKAKANKNANGINQYNNYMGLYMSQMQPINNQPQGYYEGYQNIYYYNGINAPYQYQTQMIGYNPYFHQYILDQPKTLEEHAELIYQRGIVNNIIGAFFIKECLEKNKNNEKRKVPVATVDLEEDQSNNDSNNNNKEEKKKKINEDNKKESINEEKNCENEIQKEEMNNTQNNNLQTKSNNEQKNELKKPEFKE